MSTPDRVLGSDPLDVVRVTLSRRLRRILFEAGVVDSPELPVYDTPPAARRAREATGAAGQAEKGEAA